MLTITVILTVLAIGLIFGSTKLKRRAKSTYNKVSNAISDKLGDARDDREEAIKEREKDNRTLENQLVSVKTEITLAKQKQENAFKDAEKYGRIAKDALKSGNEEAAKKAISQKQKNEELSVSLLKTVQGLEGRFEELKGLLSHSKDEVEQAKSNQEIFKTEYVALQLEKQMVEAENSFGGLGKLSLDGPESELARMKAEVQAKRELNGGVLQDFERSERESRVLEELNQMKTLA